MGTWLDSSESSLLNPVWKREGLLARTKIALLLYDGLARVTLETPRRVPGYLYMSPLPSLVSYIANTFTFIFCSRTSQHVFKYSILLFVAINSAE